jgi:hypothetical protein
MLIASRPVTGAAFSGPTSGFFLPCPIYYDFYNCNPVRISVFEFVVTH